MIRIALFLLLSAPALAQTRCDTLAHDIDIHRQISAIQSRTITTLQKQNQQLQTRISLSDQAQADLEARASREITALRTRYASYVKPPTRWQRLGQGVGPFVGGMGTGMLLLLILR